MELFGDQKIPLTISMEISSIPSCWHVDILYNLGMERERQPQEITSAQRKTIRELHAQGVRLVPIARQIGCDVSTILSIIRETRQRPLNARRIRTHQAWSRDMYLPREQRHDTDKPIRQSAHSVEEVLPLPATPNHELATRIKRKGSSAKPKPVSPVSLHTRSRSEHAEISLVPEGTVIPMDKLIPFILEQCPQILTPFELVVVRRRLEGETLAQIAEATGHSYDYTENCAVWGFQKIEISILNPAGYRSVGSYQDRNFTSRVQKAKSIKSIKIGGGRYVLDEDARKYIKS